MIDHEHLIRKKWAQFWFDDDFKHRFTSGNPFQWHTISQKYWTALSKALIKKKNVMHNCFSGTGKKASHITSGDCRLTIHLMGFEFGHQVPVNLH